jgi:hypothetical protein
LPFNEGKMNIQTPAFEKFEVWKENSLAAFSG